MPDDVLITNPFEPMDLGRVTASDDLPNGGVSGGAEDDAQNENSGDPDTLERARVGGGQARRRTPKSGALACMAVGAMTPSTPAAPVGATYPADSSSSGWSSVREIVRMRHQGRLFPQQSLDEDGDEYVPFRSIIN